MSIITKLIKPVGCCESVFTEAPKNAEEKTELESTKSTSECVIISLEMEKEEVQGELPNAICVELNAEKEKEEEAEALPLEKEDSKEADTPGENEQAALDIRSYFKEKGFEIDTSRGNLCIGPVESIAFAVANNYNVYRDFLKYLRDIITKKSFHMNYSLSSYSNSQRDSIVKLGEMFGDYGIISSFFYNKSLNSITGVISSAPRIINFLNGDYLEFYGRAVAERTVKEAASSHGVDCEIYSNVMVFGEGITHELDMVFRVGEHVFWSEIKSGKFTDFDHYRKIGVQMGVNPDRHILLAAEKNDEETEVISWFYQFYVSNIKSFKGKLNEMIENAFTGGKNND